MPAPTANSRRLSARTVQPGHVRTWTTSEHGVAEWCELLLPDSYTVVAQPRDLADLYRREPRPAGLIPELKIHNTHTGRYVYVEVKRQGEHGNAEERVYKLFTPTFIAAVGARTGLPYHPFVAVFCDDLATHPRYQVRFAAHLEPGSYLCWAGNDPALLAAFLDELRARWLEPACVGGPTGPASTEILDGLNLEAVPAAPATAVDQLTLL